jgi:hypothetical protein
MSSITSGGTPRSGKDLAGSQGVGRRPQVPGRDDRAAARLTSLALLGHMLRSRSFYERVAFAAIVLAALAKLGQENQARSFARLAAWNKRQVQRLERKAKGAITPSGS